MDKKELGEDLMADYWEQRNAHQPMVNALKNKDGLSAWCKDARTKREPDTEACIRLLSESLQSALSELEQRFGKDMENWEWGQAHVAHAEHRPFTKVASLAAIFDVRVPSAGDTYTVNVGRYSLRNEAEPFTNRHAAGLRAIYDLADLENSRFVHSTGQSGNVLSPFYRNYTERWASGRYIPMQMERAAIEKRKLGSLRLQP